MNVYEALSNIQKDLIAPKNQYNTFGGYNYRSCEDILGAAKKIMPAKSTIVIDDDLVFVGDRYYIKAVATFSLDGESVSCAGLARESESRKGMDDSQLTGSTSSYARKYALNGLFMIDDTKDADATNTHGKTSTATPPKGAKNTRSKVNKAAVETNLKDLISYIDSCKDTDAALAEVKKTYFPKLGAEDRATIIGHCTRKKLGEDKAKTKAKADQTKTLDDLDGAVKESDIPW